MNKYVYPAALVAAVGLTACNQQAANDTSAAAASPAAPEAVALDNRAQKMSYGMAYQLSSRMAAEGFDVDVAAFTEGLRDAASGAEPKISDADVQAEMQSWQTEKQAAMEAERAASAEGNLAAAVEFLAKNAAAEGVVVTESGLQYQIIEAGDGAMAGPADAVEVHYRGTLLDGTEFDSSYARNQTVTFGVGQVIPGWTEALQMMPVGSKWKLFIPPDLAYGAGGAGQLIGPNSALIFDVELINVIPAEASAEEAPAEG